MSAASSEGLRQRKTMADDETETSTTAFPPSSSGERDITAPVQRPKRSTLHQFHYVAIALLAATVILGSFYSRIRWSAAETAFRTRLPASVLPKATSALVAGEVIPPQLPFFADKRNFLNQIFVKKAWGWTSVAVLAHTGVNANRVNPFRPLLRWAIATASWVLFTTWFFGPSLNHRFLILTGAQCQTSTSLPGSSLVSNATETLHPSLCLPGQSVASQLSTRPYWTGGHDISGHTFILVHAFLLLVTTVSPTFAPGTKPERIQVFTALFGLAMSVLWWLMLLMTSVYFHSPPEKLSGLLVGLLGWASYWVVTG